ncbi:MAG: hypothetical protein ACRDN6_15780 [Gaiellaceae bacterium]
MSEQDERDVRLGLNEALFRDVNERLAELGEKFARPDERTDFICECARPDCTERIAMTLAEYEGVRADGRRFLVRPGHVALEVETVVSEHEEYAVVEKRDPEAAEVAAALDPRS